MRCFSALILGLSAGPQFSTGARAAVGTGGDAVPSSIAGRFLNEPAPGPSTALEEVSAFLEARIPRLNLPTTAGAWEAQAASLRQRVLDDVVFRGQAAQWRHAPAKVEWLETVPGGEGYRIRKLRYEALPGLWVPALLYEPENLSGRVPVALNVN
jgi:hypothetical protein